MSNINIISSTPFLSFERRFSITFELEDNNNNKTTVTYSIFQRIVRYFSTFFGCDYFSGAFEGKNVTEITTTPTNKEVNVDNDNQKKEIKSDDEKFFDIVSINFPNLDNYNKLNLNQLTSASNYIMSVKSDPSKSGLRNCFTGEYSVGPFTLPKTNKRIETQYQIQQVLAFMLLQKKIFYYKQGRSNYYLFTFDENIKPDEKENVMGYEVMTREKLKKR